MPQITIKTKYVKKLKELGIYDQWLQNLKDQWDEWSKGCSVISVLEDAYSFEQFIKYSFRWSDTPEKREFWEEISLK